MTSLLLIEPSAGAHLKRAEAKAASQRGRLAFPTIAAPSPVRIGGIEVDLANNLVRSSGRAVRLRAGEFKLLAMLISRPGAIFSRDRLAEELWPARPSVGARTVDQKIRRLRCALNRGLAPDPICSVHGKGYKFSESYEQDYALWLSTGRKRCHLDELASMRRRRMKR